MSVTPDPTFNLPLTRRGVMRLSARLRETYLTPEDGEGSCITQACGHEIRVWIPSERRSIRLDIETDGWMARRPYQQSIHRWGVTMSRYLSDGSDEPSIAVDHTGDKPTVDVDVTVVPIDEGVYDDVP